jgi:hypothetical protein
MSSSNRVPYSRSLPGVPLMMATIISLFAAAAGQLSPADPAHPAWPT